METQPVVPMALPALIPTSSNGESASGRAIVERVPEGAVMLSPNPMDRQFDFWTSLPGDRPESRAVVLRAMSSQVQRGGDMLGKPIAVADALCHPVELENEKTGEITNEIRMVLIGPDGTMTSFVSRGAFKSLGLICRLYGKLPWSPPLTLVVSQFTTRKGFRSYNIEVVPAETPKLSTGRRRD